MKNQLLTMLQMQDAMNTRVHPQWRDQGFPWYRAIWTECAELMDHYGWKWWKKQAPDMAQVKLELVDIWHFGLSILLLSGDPEDALADTVAHRLQASAQDGEFREHLEAFTLQTLKTQSFDPGLFAELLAAAQMTFEELYTAYVGKNVLNFFRQDHGYQDGSYRKIWGGREDNEHLVEAVAELDTDSPDFKDALYGALERRYVDSAT